jgi:hypothetical protein
MVPVRQPGALRLPKLKTPEGRRTSREVPSTFWLRVLHWPVPRRLRPSTDHVSSASRCQLDAVQTAFRCQLDRWEASFRTPLQDHVGASAPTPNLLEDRKTLCQPGHFGDLNGRETHSASSFGTKRSEVAVQPLSFFRPRSDARRELRLSDGRESGPAAMGSRQFDLASGRSMRHTEATSVTFVSSA